MSAIAPLAGLSPEQLAQVQVVTGGSALAWREANVDFAVVGLLERLVGIKSHRSHMRSIVGMTSSAKGASSRENGKKRRKATQNPAA